MDTPILTYNIEDKSANSCIRVNGYEDGCMELVCVEDTKAEGDEKTEIYFTSKGVSALKRAISLWETAMELEQKSLKK